ncbi:hypothetical protein ACFW9F_07325 [Streptomyces sp. NPDC059506]|uniref:hypothetical protein n=1 Tax=Streptomyces TaxID=1883 RepID=UPI0022AA8710|nr:hypothetical protein [Streptomyces sp. HB2AG]MCZ2525266.1 hypothetical protein [Streptomyces sp. HB2AG]
MSWPPHGQPWHPGLCWRCEADGVPVAWAGDIAAHGGHVALWLCDPCYRRWGELAWRHLQAHSRNP